MGVLGAALVAAAAADTGPATMTAGPFAASSPARAGRRSLRPSAQRSSITTCAPSFQPSAASPSLNAANSARSLHASPHAASRSESVASIGRKRCPSSQAPAMPLQRGETPVALSGTSCPFECGEVNLHEHVRGYGPFDHRICARMTASQTSRMGTSVEDRWRESS